MPKKKGVVAFDFDGVIGDSVKECYVQSAGAYADIGGRVATSRNVEKKFREARPLITKVEHFFTVMQLIQQNPKIKFARMTQEAFDAEHKKNAAQVAEFAKRFYARREELKVISRKEWLALQRSFPGIARFIAKIQQKSDVFIATTKDKKSVMELLRAYGINIPESHILSKDFSTDKKQQLQEIARRARVSSKAIVLVDDAVKQIRDAKKIGVEGVLVRWGYSTRSQRKAAKREKIPIIRKANVWGRMKLRKAQRRARK